jgi:hypothetical protein
MLGRGRSARTVDPEDLFAELADGVRIAQEATASSAG